MEHASASAQRPTCSTESSNSSGLWPISDQLHLWTCATARSHVLLRHWLHHYQQQGVRAANAHVIVHEDFAPPHTVRSARHVLESAGVVDVTWQPSVNSTVLELLKLKHINTFIREGLPPDGWLIFADADEFFVYPCDTLQALRRAKREAACAFQQDRVAEDLSSILSVQANPPIEQQYPRCAKLRALLHANVQGNPLKIALLRARPWGQVPYYYTAHRVYAGKKSIGGFPSGSGNGCVMLPRFAHYAMTYEAIELSRRRVADGYGFSTGGTYMQTMRLVVPCNATRNGCYQFAPTAKVESRLMPCGEGCSCVPPPAER
tara:strand:- start:1874 stop:2830 length:957 start_codon:yes stop_codon:yes gene_type:complete